MNFLAKSLNFQTIQNTNIWAQEWLAVWQGARANRRETSRLSSLSAEFLRSEDGRALASAHVLPELCALSSQHLSPDVGTSSLPAEAALKQVRGFFRRAVQSAEDVQGTLDSAWPLYGMLHSLDCDQLKQ